MARDFHLTANLSGLVDDANRSFFDRDVEFLRNVSCCAPSDACGRSTADHVYHQPEGLRLAFTAERAGRPNIPSSSISVAEAPTRVRYARAEVLARLDHTKPVLGF